MPTLTSGGKISVGIGGSGGETVEVTDGAMSSGDASASTTEPWVDERTALAGRIFSLLAPSSDLGAGAAALG